MNDTNKKCSKCHNDAPIKYYTRGSSDGFTYSQCYFCRSTKDILRAKILKQDVENTRLSDLVKKKSYMYQTLVDSANNKQNEIYELQDRHKIIVDSWSDKFDEAVLLHEQLAEELTRTQNKLRAAAGHNICEEVKRNNDILRADIANIKNTMADRVEFETRELRAELKTLRRAAKKQRQRDKKRAMVASSSYDTPPPEYDCSDIPPPVYSPL